MPTTEIVAMTDMLAVYAKATGLSPNGVVHDDTYVMLRCFDKDVHKRGDRNPSLLVNFKTKSFFCCANKHVKGGMLDFVKAAVPDVRDNRGAVHWLINNGLVGQEIDVASMEVVEGSSADDYSSKRLIATHTYLNEHGENHIRVQRYKCTLKSDGSIKKECYQKRWEDNMWKDGTRGVRQIPYRLPQLLEAAREHLVVQWPEGENKVEAFERIGLVGSTNAGGTSMTEYPLEWGAFVQGVRGIIIPTDCDEVGRKAAAYRQEFFRSVGVPAAVFDIAPERTDGYDVGDWIVEREKAGQKPAQILAEYRSLYRSREIKLGVA